MAACATAKQGAKVIAVEPSRWLGGLAGGGLMHIDGGREEAVSGSTRPILTKDFKDAQHRAVFAEMLKSAGVTVLFEHRVSVALKVDGVIRTIDLDLAPFDEYGCPPAKPTKAMARVIKAKVFIDCSYEGDLMARACVAYAFGREAKSAYGESLAGAQPPMSVCAPIPVSPPSRSKSPSVPGSRRVRSATPRAIRISSMSGRRVGWSRITSSPRRTRKGGPFRLISSALPPAASMDGLTLPSPQMARLRLWADIIRCFTVEDKTRGIYQIPSRSIVPKKAQCENLLVPVGVSASHIAMTSIRMEPAWMVLGKSAGVAAALALKSGLAVQDIPYAELQPKLRARHQKLEPAQK